MKQALIVEVIVVRLVVQLGIVEMAFATVKNFIMTVEGIFVKIAPIRCIGVLTILLITRHP
jgi:hypothetical protein